MKIPTYNSRPDDGRTYRPKKVAPAGEPRKPRLYDSRRWRGTDKKLGCRDLKLRQDPLCERCLLHGKHEPATDVHHRTDVKAAPELAYDLTNLEALCHEHHSAETMRRNRGKKQA